ncbi:hypothetical protein [Nocardia spumae]|uniref:hypothetical protein n=1 Tax=Nocardia spumae TaxID=2887190 RepID=UPI001D13A84C|nr:hypothetical protein [Nocardia spumae]
MSFSDGDASRGRIPLPGPAAWVVALWGAVVAICSAPFAAALVASLYRFPIPFGDYARGLNEALNAALASIFYLVIGGIVPLALAGAIAGFLLARRNVRGRARCLALTAATGFAMACVCALLLALLEYAIGPW